MIRLTASVGARMARPHFSNLESLVTGGALTARAHLRCDTPDTTTGGGYLGCAVTTRIDILEGAMGARRMRAHMGPYMKVVVPVGGY